MGSGIGSLEDTVDVARLLPDTQKIQDTEEVDRQLKAAYRRISPMYVPRILTNMAAGHLSIRYGLLVSNGCV